MVDEGVAGLAGGAPEGAVVADHRLGLIGHPGIGFAHRFPQLAIEKGFEAHAFLDQARRHRQHHAPRENLRYFAAAAEVQHDVITPVDHTGQDVVEMQRGRGEVPAQGCHQRTHATLHAPGAAMQVRPRERLRRLVMIGEVQDFAGVMLRKALQAEILDQTRDTRLGIRPEPRGSKVQCHSRRVAGHRKDAAAQSAARLENGERASLGQQMMGQLQSAQTRAYDRRFKHDWVLPGVITQNTQQALRHYRIAPRLFAFSPENPLLNQ